MSAPERLTVSRGNCRVLTIQSHVVSGYAGNKCSVFPLQLHGFETDVINSVQFSNHTGYRHLGGVRGQKLNSDDLCQLLEGLRANRLDQYSHILTGYCGDPLFLEQIADFVKEQKSKNAALKYICDPVLGDDGVGYYTPPTLMPVFRDRVLKFADILTPNAFELRELTGSSSASLAACVEAVNQLHDKYKIPMVVVTSGIESDGESLKCLSSQVHQDGSRSRHVFTFPKVGGSYVGTGDVFASLLLVWVADLNSDLRSAVEKTLLSLQTLIKRTRDRAYGDGSKKPGPREKEIMLVESRYDLLCPTGSVDCETL